MQPLLPRCKSDKAVQVHASARLVIILMYTGSRRVYTFVSCLTAVAYTNCMLLGELARVQNTCTLHCNLPGATCTRTGSHHCDRLVTLTPGVRPVGEGIGVREAQLALCIIEPARQHPVT